MRWGKMWSKTHSVGGEEREEWEVEEEEGEKEEDR